MTEITLNDIVWTMSIAALIMSVACLVLVYSVWVLIQAQKKPQTDESTESATGDSPASSTPSWLSWSRIRQKLTDAVPVAEEASIDLGHNYDGIRELDNNLPPWWKYGFYVTIGIGFVYLIHFHVFELSFLSPVFGPGISSAEEYQAEMLLAEEQKAIYLEKVANLVNENTVESLTDESSLRSGQTIYTKYCAACHGPEGQGGIGPNLADQYWIHGGGIKNVFSTVKYGVLEKGMIAWQTQLKPKEMQEVASYILTMEGTNPANPKDPQGELYIPSDTTSTDSTQIAMIR